MKRHIDEGPSPGLVPNKEGLYSRANPVSPPGHILGPAMSTGASSIISNVQSVQSILHMTSQPASVPPVPTPQMYAKDNNITAVQYSYGSSKATVQPPLHMRPKVHTSSSMTVPGPGTPPGTSSQQHFQRLKVEDALSYLDQVKFKFGNQPQVYNDFLDIMKEFKSQSIDTPGVIQRVSNLFKGHPELIVGFNTFLPPGYKIEVQSNEQGVAFQVSVSMPSPTASTTTLIQTSHHQMAPQSETITVVPSGVKHSTPGPLPPRTTSPQPASSHFAHSAPPTASNLLTSSAFGMLPISQQPAHMAVSHALNNVDSPHATPASQPVEFNHAINYVNKIKNRFQGQPDKYKKFLEILHTYQKEQRNAKEGTCGGTKHLTEAEVYSQVSKLFEHQEDLLAEFGQFLPDATSHLNAKTLQSVEHPTTVKKSSSTLKTLNLTRDSSGSDRDTPRSSGPKTIAPSLKRSASFSSGTPKKYKMTSLRDVTVAEAGKYANLTDYAFFDKVRRALKNQDIYENFLRCLMLYNQEILSKVELVQLVQQFLARFPDLYRWFKDFLGVPDQTSMGRIELIPSGVRQERPPGDLAMEIDYSTCKRLGASYCALPKSFLLPKSSGRTALCREVLNDTWVSFPTWSEDSTFVTSRKTVFEEYIYRCEDERFELDVVIETNGATIRVLEAVQKKISRMSPEEAQKFRLDDCLGGTSPTIHIRAISRVYGDKAPDMIDGLKKSPLVAIPVVLRRLRAKEDEWRDAQKGFNKIWREQNEKYYLKSLDHQGMNFKQTDVKYLGSKSLYNEIESIFEERHENTEDGAPDTGGPHLTLAYKDKTILDDAANLLIHHAKRLSGLQKEDKHKIKVILRHFLPDLFQHPRQELSEDEKDEFDEMDVDEKSNDPTKSSNGVKTEAEPVPKEEPEDVGPNDGSYSLFMANNNWYLFLRLHQILCERLTKMYERSELLAVEEAKDKQNRKESTSVALRLKPKVEVEVCDYYPTLLDMVKGLLDGNMESNSYEDTLREMFGIHAYLAFTLDKVVTTAVRQLQHIVCDDAPQGCMELYVQEAKRGGAGGLLRTQHQRLALESAYQKKLEQLLSDESCYKVYIYHNDCKMTIELLDTESDEPDNTVESLKWAQYRNEYAESMKNFPTEEYMQSMDKPVFLPRNVRAWKKLHSKTPEEAAEKPEVADAPMEGVESSGDRSPDENPPKPPLSRMGDRPPSDTVGHDNSECRFNLNDYKILFVINKDNLLYKNNALSNAKKGHPRVTKIKDRKFGKWVNAWVEENCSESDVKLCKEWLMGKGPDVVANRTVIRNDNDPEKPPYIPYNRYTVELFE